MLFSAIPNPVWGGHTDAGPGVLEDAAEVIRACLPEVTNVADKGASIARDATAVMIDLAPRGGLGRRASGAEWIALDPTWVARMKS